MEIITTDLNLTWMKVRINNAGRGGFPGGAVVKNPPANAGDTGSSPGPGRSHIKKKNNAGRELSPAPA